jgi:hypothetical protein
MHDAGDRIVMDISIEEAMFLTFVLAFVGGSSERSPRKHQETLSGALYNLGFHYDHLKTHKMLSKEAGIDFREGTDIKDIATWKRK